MKHLVGIEW